MVGLAGNLGHTSIRCPFARGATVPAPDAPGWMLLRPPHDMRHRSDYTPVYNRRLVQGRTAAAGPPLWQRLGRLTCVTQVLFFARRGSLV